MTVEAGRALALVDAVAEQLATPEQAHSWITSTGDDGWWPQSLARGAAGVALLHVERARAGLADWRPAHRWLACAAGGDVSTGANASLFYGAPAVAFVLREAAQVKAGAYRRALDNLDTQVDAIVHRRLAAAHTRINEGALPAFAEYDLVYGLTGLCVYLLGRERVDDTVGAVLSYLVRLTDPLRVDGETLPGWWTALAPDGEPSPAYPGGHGNLSLSHGASGPLAVLSLAARRDILVPGQLEAIHRICGWLDDWRQDQAGPWWPERVTRAELRRQRPEQSAPARPSWCYGTPGLARAQHLAGQATGDPARTRMAERALLSCLFDGHQVAKLTDHSLCHGLAGLIHTVRRFAANTPEVPFSAYLPRLLATVLDHDPSRTAQNLLRRSKAAGGLGLLEGATGVALAMHSAAVDPNLTATWDAHLLLN